MRRIKNIIFMALLAFAFSFAVTNANAGSLADVKDYSEENFQFHMNSTTNYATYVLDEADLLSEDEEKKLSEDMKPITEYGHCAFIATEVKGATTATAAQQFYSGIFGTQP